MNSTEFVRERAKKGMTSRMKVSHPDYGSMIIPAYSAFDAAIQASIAWKADWSDMMQRAKVQLAETKENCASPAGQQV